MRAKKCSQCPYVGGLFKSNPPLCKNCAMVYNATNKDKIATKVCIKAKHYVIPKVSKNRQEALKTYRRRRDNYFKEHPICEFPDCNSKNITLHHMKGRIGAFLTDKRYFKSLCAKHHRYVEENPLEAFKLGLSVKRLDK
jgi:hypothetical protein